MIDLHTHSTASDGSYSPSDLISTAVGKGLKYIALTDHNTVRGLKEVYIAAKQYDIHLINGTELSCEHNTHIIGLFLKRLDEINSKDIIRNKYMEQSLNGYGYTKEEYGTLRGARDAFVKMISGFGGSNAAILASKHPLFDDRSQKLPTYQMTHHIVLTPDDLQIDGEHKSLTSYDGNVITAIYKDHIGDYPKFYKMDMLSRLAFVASELLLRAEGKSRDIPCENRAVVLFNHSSSLQADKSYLATIADDDEFFPSPSVFVYTLPNIAVAEIAMRNHYHGETSFFILPNKDEHLMNQVIDASFLDNGIESMITGWLDYEDNGNFVANLYIVEKTNIKISES